MKNNNFSRLLEELIDTAKSVGGRNGPLSPERFIVALLGRCERTRDEDKNEELRVAEALLRVSIKDIGAARDILISGILSEKEMSYSSIGYMDKRLEDARKAAEDSANGIITVAILLGSICKEPTETVKRAFESGAAGKTTDKKATEKSEDAETNGSVFDPIPLSRENTTEDSGRKRDMGALVEEVEYIRRELSAAVLGQDNAINLFVSGYFRSEMLSSIEKAKRKPKATFLFAGPPGVGKTFLAEQAAKVLGGLPANKELKFRRFDMSEYSDKEAHVDFCGSNAVYSQSKPGVVTTFVSDNPKCILLFDEIEKAHSCIINLFLQILDAGQLTDVFHNKQVSFSEAIIIFTTNAGKQFYEDSETGDFSSVPRKVIINALKKDVDPHTGIPYFPAAICSRFASGNVVMFNHIGASILSSIAKNEILRNVANLKTETGMEMEVGESVYAALLFSEGATVDARTIKARAGTFINDELYELLSLIASMGTGAGVNSIEKINIDVDFSRVSREAATLFVPEKMPKVLVFADDETVDICAEKLLSVEVIGVRDLESSIEVMKKHDISFAMVDMRFGMSEDGIKSLHIEDTPSLARDFYRFVRDQRKSLPVYLIENAERKFSEEERLSFLRQGVRGILKVSRDEPLEETISEIAMALHRQESMERLAKQNKIVSFETSQTISADGKYAEIKLIELMLSVAVDSEDNKAVIGTMSMPEERFKDVIGAEDAKRELAYFVEYLKNPKKYIGTGVKPPRGVLLYGPPGTGKTMLAKAMANESNVTFISTEGNRFIKKYVGEGSEEVHRLFATARKYAPTVLFVDEIEAIAKARTGAFDGSTSTAEQVLTAFLTEMDGFTKDNSKPVFVLAATNFEVEPGSAKSLDPALLRRFDRRIFIDLPRKEDRMKFIKKKIEENHVFDISQNQLDTIVTRSTGMSLADLDSAMELAIRSAIREGSAKVTDAVLEEAFEIFNNGDVKKWDSSQLERVARHEAGHAFMSWHSGDTPTYLTIVARGNHGGYMQRAEKEGKAIYTKDELLASIRTSLGGRAAELAYYGDRDGISTGASGDLANATNTAMRIVGAYGMDETFGLSVVVSDVASGGAMSVEVRDAVNRILDEQMAETTRIISENKDMIDALVEQLMRKNHMNEHEIEDALMAAEEKRRTAQTEE